MGCRAVLVGVSGAAGIVAPNIVGLPYAPYSQIFARSSVIVHQGGSGTTGQALRAGRPMIVVPFGWDQPDNAARVERLGLGLAVSREAYSSTAASAINRVLTEPTFAARAAEIGERVRQEDALTIACNAIERPPRSGPSAASTVLITVQSKSLRIGAESSRTTGGTWDKSRTPPGDDAGGVSFRLGFTGANRRWVGAVTSAGSPALSRSGTDPG